MPMRFPASHSAQQVESTPRSPRSVRPEAFDCEACAQLLAILQAMRAAIWTVAGLRSALCARRDILLEILALRHQLCVFARSNRRFRPSDRPCWLCLRRLWPQWREALVLVQPGTVV